MNRTTRAPKSVLRYVLDKGHVLRSGVILANVCYLHHMNDGYLCLRLPSSCTMVFVVHMATAIHVDYHHVYNGYRPSRL